MQNGGLTGRMKPTENVLGDAEQHAPNRRFDHGKRLILPQLPAPRSSPPPTGRMDKRWEDRQTKKKQWRDNGRAGGENLHVLLYPYQKIGSRWGNSGADFATTHACDHTFLIRLDVEWYKQDY